MPTSNKLKNSKRQPVGIFLPVSALPSRFGIGDFGPGLDRFLRWAASAGATHWQILPLTLPDSTGSPYASPSALAGNWWNLDLEAMARQGWLSRSQVQSRRLRASPVKYRQAIREKKSWLRQAHKNFLDRADLRQVEAWRIYCHRQETWLDPMASYFALKDRFGNRPWWRWPSWARRYSPQLIRTSRLQKRFDFYTWLQWQFDLQWRDVRKTAKTLGLKIIGDVPFYLPEDSVEVWSEPRGFHLDRLGRPRFVSGAPPDVFNRKGQRWGTPTYDWKFLRRSKFQLWRRRLGRAAGLYDEIRLDHFRGYVKTWQIPRNRTAAQGSWVATPSTELWRVVKRAIPTSRLIAENLGTYMPAAETWCRKIGLRTLRVWEFGWNGLPDNVHALDQIDRRSVLATSTHDTNTVEGWWKLEARPYERSNLRRHGPLSASIHTIAIRQSIQTRASLVLVPLADVLGLGSAGRYNRPGRVRRNWAWRFPLKQLKPKVAREFRRVVDEQSRSR